MTKEALNQSIIQDINNTIVESKIIYFNEIFQNINDLCHINSEIK